MLFCPISSLSWCAIPWKSRCGCRRLDKANDARQDLMLRQAWQDEIRRRLALAYSPVSITAMCKLLHIEWRCHHAQNVWQYCRDAPRSTNTNRIRLPCEDFVKAHSASPTKPTADEYRNHCCRFPCCETDKAPLYQQVRAVEKALGLGHDRNLPFKPRLLLTRQERSCKELRRQYSKVKQRHDERCDALHYGLGWVEENDGYQVPARPAPTDAAATRAPYPMQKLEEVMGRLELGTSKEADQGEEAFAAGGSVDKGESQYLCRYKGQPYDVRSQVDLLDSHPLEELEQRSRSV